jgi:hypothetical protein
MFNTAGVLENNMPWYRFFPSKGFKKFIEAVDKYIQNWERIWCGDAMSSIRICLKSRELMWFNFCEMLGKTNREY